MTFRLGGGERIRMKNDSLKVQRMATKTRLLIQELRLFVSSMRFSEPTSRRRLATSLLMASMEHGEGAAFLMEQGPLYYGSPASALARPQIECFLRGVFFHSDASTDQEVVAFIENDEWPTRLDGKSKRKVSLGDMETIAIEGLGKISAQLSSIPMTQLFPFQPNELHGFVHGGAALVKNYRINQTSTGFNAPASELLSLLGNAGLVAGYALSYIVARIANYSGNEPAALREAHDAFKAEILDR
jgi:hypothetical protein